MPVVARHRAEHRRGFEREDPFGVDLGYGAVERVVRDDVAPRRDPVHVHALGARENQPLGVALREHVVGDLDDEREVAANPLLVQRRVVVVQHGDDMQRRVVVDVEIVRRRVAADAAHVFDHQTAGFDELVEDLERVPAELRPEIVVAVDEPRRVARNQDVGRRRVRRSPTLRIFLDDPQHVGFGPDDAAADGGRGRHEARVGEPVGEVELRVVQRAFVFKQRLQHRFAPLGAVFAEDDGQTQRFARARPDDDAILERPEDATAHQFGELGRHFAQVRRGIRELALGKQRSPAHVLQHDLFAQRDVDRGRLARTGPPARGAGLQILRTDEAVFGVRLHFVLGFAVKALADEQRPRKD